MGAAAFRGKMTKCAEARWRVRMNPLDWPEYLDESRFQVFFGGPDLPPRALTDMLAQRTAAVPPGGAIDWVTYYFRDRQLAQELIKAHARGVHVRVTVEGRPRSAHANDDVIGMFREVKGLAEGIRSVALPAVPLPRGHALKPHLHEKLYCFSHPEPVAFIGSFNPSGNLEEREPEVIEEIGDQDRGYNYLVGLRDAGLVDRLVLHARSLNRQGTSFLDRFSSKMKRVTAADGMRVFLLPCASRHPALRSLEEMGGDVRIRLAASHIKGIYVAKALRGLAGRGADVEVFAETTRRRVPDRVETFLSEGGVSFTRLRHPDGVPMHCKFVLAERGVRRRVIFGSFNWTCRSFYLNHEIVAVSDDENLFDAFSARWNKMTADSKETAAGG